MIWVSAFTTFAVLVSGAFYFRRIERTFADNI
jgi:ABC-type polysaccharide/polyol phosphate export permease